MFAGVLVGIDGREDGDRVVVLARQLAAPAEVITFAPTRGIGPRTLTPKSLTARPERSCWRLQSSLIC